MDDRVQHVSRCPLPITDPELRSPDPWIPDLKNPAHFSRYSPSMQSDKFHLRPFQRQALEILNTRSQTPTHVICVAPTGSGKSLIYERLAQDPKARTLLFTPLVALGRQQELRLRDIQIPVAFGSSEPAHSAGIWILSPESLESAQLLERAAHWKPNLLVVDECHCLWDWGEEFRPAFRKIPELIQKLKIPRSLWLTATLPPDARANLKSQLPSCHEVGEFDLPPGLDLRVSRVPWISRAQVLTAWVLAQRSPGVIFANTRESTVRIARLLQEVGVAAKPYHAGMSREERLSLERGFALAHEKNLHTVIVATSAFGMGMHLPHLRWVALWQAPLSLLALTQAIGRAGRGIQGTALVLWDEDDFRILDWAVQRSLRKQEELRRTYDFLQSHQCRRRSLQQYFDLATSQYSRTRCDLCDVCASI